MTRGLVHVLGALQQQGGAQRHVRQQHEGHIVLLVGVAVVGALRHHVRKVHPLGRGRGKEAEKGNKRSGDAGAQPIPLIGHTGGKTLASMMLGI